MYFLDKSTICKNPIKLLRFKEIILNSKKKEKKKELSLTNINSKNNESDKDKLNLENINYLEKDIFKTKVSKTQCNSFNSKFNNSYIKNICNPILKNKNNIFGNKLIRNFNKKEIHINIFEHEISMKNIFKTKNNIFFDNKYEVVKDEKSDTINNKSKILNIIRTQTKSNFNNKYRVMFKSANKKKRNLIQNYFSLIKKDLKYNYEPTNLTSRKLYINNNINFPELSYRLSQKKKISKDILNKLINKNNNLSQISNKQKNKKIFIPILNTKIKEDSKLKY